MQAELLELRDFSLQEYLNQNYQSKVNISPVCTTVTNRCPLQVTDSMMEAGTVSLAAGSLVREQESGAVHTSRCRSRCVQV